MSKEACPANPDATGTSLSLAGASDVIFECQLACSGCVWHQNFHCSQGRSGDSRRCMHACAPLGSEGGRTQRRRRPGGSQPTASGWWRSGAGIGGAQTAAAADAAGAAPMVCSAPPPSLPWKGYLQSRRHTVLGGLVFKKWLIIQLLFQSAEEASQGVECTSCWACPCNVSPITVPDTSGTWKTADPTFALGFY